MPVTVTPYSSIECVLKTTALASVDLFSINSSTLAVTSAYLPQSMRDTISAQALVLRGLLGTVDFPTVLPDALPRLLTASPLSSLTALTLTTSTVGTVSTLTVSGLSNPCWFLAAAAHSITGGFNTDRGTFTSGGGGGGGAVPAPNGPYPGIPAGTPVALSLGFLVPADAGIAASMPAVGVYTGAVTDTVITSGPATTALPLFNDADQYIAIGGGFTHIAPSGVGVYLQRIGKSFNGNEVFVTVSESIENP